MARCTHPGMKRRFSPIGKKNASVASLSRPCLIIKVSNANGFWSFGWRGPTVDIANSRWFSGKVLEAPLTPEPFVGSMGTCTASWPPLLGPNCTIDTIFVRSSKPVIHGCVSPDIASSSFAAGPVMFRLFYLPNLLITCTTDSNGPLHGSTIFWI